MIYNCYNRLVNTFGLVEDKELDMIGCSLIIVLRVILVCSIFATTCMQGLYTNNCLEVNLFCITCRERTTHFTVTNQTVPSQTGLFYFLITDKTCFQTTIQNHHLNNC